MGNLHLVTGYAGASHVTAADAASLNAAIVGSGSYVLNRGNQFAATIVSNNKITIADGDLLMQGRHIRLNEGSTVDLTIENGASGYYRNDLIVARYTMDSNSGVENCNLVVIKGTAVSSNPTDPEYTSGDIINDHVLIADMPLYRVPLDGLNVQTLVPLFTVITKSLDNDDSGKQESTEKLTTGTTLADGDYFPFYDVSVSGHRKVLWSRIVTMIRTALFGSLNGVLKANGSGYVSTQTVETAPIANSANLVTSGGVKAALDKKANKLTLIKTMVSGETVTADFTSYEELVIVCDIKNNGFASCGVTFTIPTAVLPETTGYFGAAYSEVVSAKITATKTTVAPYEVEYAGSTVTGYKFYIYGR